MTEKQPDTGRIREIPGVICLALAIFLLLCLASYYPLDPSFTHFVAESVKTRNLVGYAGSYTADSLIRLLGLSAFLLPLVILIASVK